ncbi:MAG: glycosyltransferase [Eubacteriales bacterium]|nr:glycosyltransferase [Eubacteriales bacterium]
MKLDNKENGNRSPYFSIVIPAFNVNVQYFTECINSLIGQSFSDYEVIIVDDGSEKTYSLAYDDAAAKDERIRVIHKENQGVSIARNVGVKAARGKWISFVDADDWMEKDALKTIHYHLCNQNCDMLMFRASRDSADSSVDMDYGLKTGTLYDFGDYETKRFFYHRVMQVPNAKKKRLEPIYYSWDKVYSRLFLLDNELEFPAGVAKSEDKIFIALCFEKAKKLYYIGNTLYHYRMNDESVCHSYSAKMVVQRQMLADILLPMAKRMDAELSVISGKENSQSIYDECERFIFGIISDVLILQFYHKDNPQKNKRRKEALVFLHTEPFSVVIDTMPNSRLSKSARLKKWLLKNDMVTTFYYLYYLEKCINSRK